jgi:hypothetical protein
MFMIHIVSQQAFDALCTSQYRSVFCCPAFFAPTVLEQNKTENLCWSRKRYDNGIR